MAISKIYFIIYLLISIAIMISLILKSVFFINRLKERRNNFEHKIAQIKRDQEDFDRWKRRFIREVILGYLFFGISFFFFISCLSLIVFNRTTNALVFLIFPISITGIIYFYYIYFYVFPGYYKFLNFSLEDSIKLFINKIFPSAKKRIRILSGNLRPDFYGDERILNALDILGREKNVKIEILFRYPEDESAKNEIKRLINNKLSPLKKYLYSISSFEEDSPHFTVIDKSLVRLERKHAPFYVERERNSGNGFSGHEAWVYMFDYFLAFQLVKKFKRLRSLSCKI